MEVPFLAEDPPPYGEVEQVSPLVRRIVAPNPSRFTYHGTGTFIVGPPSGGKVAIIDPGPADDAHVGALLRAVEGQTVTRDESLGLSGRSGNATGPHLHFEIWGRGHQVDPVLMLGGPPG